MSNHNHGHAVPGEADDHVENLADDFGVEGSGDFIEHRRSLEEPLLVHALDAENNETGLHRARLTVILEKFVERGLERCRSNH